MEPIPSGHKSMQKTEQKLQKTEDNSKKKIAPSSTHLHLQEKYFTKMPALEGSKILSVLYLYNNKITQIENLNSVPNLTCLYLQNNKIEKIENLAHLRNLKKLYLGRNKISVIEKLESLESLEELHIERQDLSNEIPLCFDPRTILHISLTLKVLNISHNKLSSLFHLMPLRKLQEINASHNDLKDVKDVCQTINGWHYLTKAKFAGNPMTKKHRYREDIIASSYSLEVLDDKTITETTRDFIKRFEEGKIVHGSRQSINLAEHLPGLPQNYPPAIQKAVSASILKDSKNNKSLLEDMSTFDEANAAYIPWQKLPKRRPFVKLPNQQLQNRKFQTKTKKVIINTFPQINTQF